MNAYTLDLFPPSADIRNEELAPGAWLLHGFALAEETALARAVETVREAAPLRHMTTPGGLPMSVSMTNCGAEGWMSDRRGYRYVANDPASGAAWPPMPDVMSLLAQRAARQAGYAEFEPDACLVNHYQPGARMSLHRDADEANFAAPIVSVSLGLPAVFLFGGDARSDTARRLPLVHGDVLVWGGPARLRYHGVAAVKPGVHPLFGAQRINLTFRRAR